jgi:hypothetical protein
MKILLEGHVERMGAITIVYEILVRKPEGEGKRTLQNLSADVSIISYYNGCQKLSVGCGMDPYG